MAFPFAFDLICSSEMFLWPFSWWKSVFLSSALLNRFQTMKVWKNLNIYKVVADNLLDFRDVVVVRWQNAMRLSPQFTLDGFGAMGSGPPALGWCQDGVGCSHLFHFASIYLSREPGEYSVASGTGDLLDSRRSWFDRCGPRFLWAHLAETQDIIR